MPEIKLQTLEGHPYATSVDVARDFTREHKDVLDSIDLLLTSPERYLEKLLQEQENARGQAKIGLANASNGRKIPPVKPKYNAQDYDILRDFVAAQNYQPQTYIDSKGESRRSFLMTRDGFSLLAMGFNTLPAIPWKIRYLQAFNAMEAKLQAQGTGWQAQFLFPDLYERAEQQASTLTTAAAIVLVQAHSLNNPPITGEILRRHIKNGTLQATRGKNNRYEIDQQSFDRWLQLRRAA